MKLDDLFSTIYYKEVASLFQNICNTYYLKSKYKDKRLSLKRKKIKAIDDIMQISSDDCRDISSIDRLDTNRIIIYNEDFFKYDDKNISNEKIDNKNVKSFQNNFDNSSLFKLFEENLKNKFIHLNINDFNKTLKNNDKKNFPNNLNCQTSSNLEFDDYIAGEIKIYSDYLYNYFPSNFSELDVLFVDFIFNSNKNVETYLNLMLWENYLNHIELNKTIDFSNIFSVESEKSNSIQKIKMLKRGQTLMEYIIHYIEKNHFYSNQFNVFNHDFWKKIFLNIPFLINRVFSHLSHMLNSIKKNNNIVENENLEYKRSVLKTIMDILYNYLVKIRNLKEKRLLEGSLNSDINLSNNSYNHDYYDFECFEIYISNLLKEVLEISQYLDVRNVIEEMIPNFYFLMTPKMKLVIFDYLKSDIKKGYEITSENELNSLIFSKIINTIEYCLYADRTKLFMISEFFKLEDDLAGKKLIEIISDINLINLNNFDIKDIIELVKNCNEKCKNLIKFLVSSENTQIIKSYCFNKSITAVCKFYHVFKIFSKNCEVKMNDFFYEEIINDLNKITDDESIILGVKLKREILIISSNYPSEDLLFIIKNIFVNLSFDEFFTWILPFISDLTDYILEPEKRSNLIETFRIYLSKGVNIELGDNLYNVYNIGNNQELLEDHLKIKKTSNLFKEYFIPESSIKDGLIYLLFFLVTAKFFSVTSSLKNKESNEKSFSYQITKFVSIKNLSTDFIDVLVELLKNYEAKVKFLWNCYVYTLKKKSNEEEIRYTKSVVNMLNEIKSFNNDLLYLEMLEIVVIEDEKGFISKLLITYIIDNIDKLEKEDKRTSQLIKKIKDVIALLKTKFRDSLEKKKLEESIKERLNKLLK